MSEVQELADRYVQVWNEPDVATRRASIAKLWAPNGRHFVSDLEAEGYEALERRITHAYEEYVRDAGNLFRARADAQRLRDVVTFHWEMTPAGGGEILAAGLDVLLMAKDGRILDDYQYATP